MAAPPARGRVGWPRVSLLFASVLVVGFVVARSLRDPPFWDALGCYVPLARQMAAHGFELQAYRGLAIFRPPLLTALFAAAIRLGGGDPAFHVIVWAFAITLPISAWLIARALDAPRRTALIASVACLLSPIFVAQAGLEQSDLPVAALAAVAWLLALRKQRFAFVLVATAAILTKESAHFVLLPAAWLWWREAPPDRAARLRYAAPALLPYCFLFGWVLAERRIVGHVLYAGQSSLLGIVPCLQAIEHTLIEGGRLLLSLAALPAVVVAWRDRHHDRAPRSSAPTLATAGAILLLPFAFPAALPRYMLPSLSLQCALAAIGIDALVSRWRPLLVPVGVAILVALWWAPTLDSRSEWHLESNLRYRALLTAEETAVNELSREHARRVLAPFPLNLALADPLAGYARRPIAVAPPGPDLSLRTLCGSDFLVETAEESTRPAEKVLRAAGALTLEREIDAAGQRIRIFRVSCPSG